MKNTLKYMSAFAVAGGSRRLRFFDLVGRRFPVWCNKVQRPYKTRERDGALRCLCDVLVGD